MAGRLVSVVCALGTPEGRLPWPAWQALQSGPVLVEPRHPQLPALVAAGVAVEPAAPGRTALGQAREHVAAGRSVVLLTADAVEGADEVHVASYAPAGARLLDVVAVMDRLRSPGGCPWDAEQTHATLMPYLLEEAYEAYQALEDGDPVDLREELGDVLLQVVFHARIASESSWDVDDVAGDLVDKLVRRHPHVFGPDETGGLSADDLEGSWEAIKAAEKGRTSVTDGVPLSQPALSLASKLQKRAGRLGAPLSADGPGAELWDLVARLRAEGVDPEVALRATARGYRDRLALAERAATAEGLDPADLDEQAWARLLP